MLLKYISLLTLINVIKRYLYNSRLNFTQIDEISATRNLKSKLENYKEKKDDATHAFVIF
jgi:hypothetical protein